MHCWVRVASIARVGENERAAGGGIFARWVNERLKIMRVKRMQVLAKRMQWVRMREHWRKWEWESIGESGHFCTLGKWEAVAWEGMQSADWLSLIELWPPLQHTANLLFRSTRSSRIWPHSTFLVKWEALEIDPKSGSDYGHLLQHTPNLLFSSKRSSQNQIDISCHLCNIQLINLSAQKGLVSRRL